MSVLLRKEIRLLLPSFIIALPLAFSVCLIPDEHQSSGLRMSLVLFPFLLCPAMVIMLALDSFGREMSSGTFSSLLAQPVPRARIWWTKTTLLALALVILLIVWLLSWFLYPPRGATNANFRDMTAIAGLFALVAYSGGLWTVLLFRQVAAAFWFTVLTPVALLVTIINLLEDHPERIKATLIVTLSFYSVAGFLWAWRMFVRAQDVAWTGGAVTLPSFRFAPQQLAGRAEKRRRRPRLALFARELQLHQSQFMIAGVLVILHLGLIAARHFGHGFKQYSALEFVANQFWFLWLITPLLVGCASVAEERKLGTLEGQLCLPVRRRSQFFVKLFVVFVLSVLLGAGMPVLLEGNRILPDIRIDFAEVLGNFSLLSGGIILQTILTVLAALQSLPFNLLGFLVPATICAVVGALSFYASSFARNTLQALAPATLSLLLAWLLLLGAYQPEDLLEYPLWRGPLIYLIGVPIMTLTLGGLMYWNYQRVQIGWNVWRRNLLTLLAALVFSMGVTTAVYHRVWEYLAPLDSPHGAARLEPSGPTTLRSDAGSLALLLPDGRLWMSRLSFAEWSSLVSGQPGMSGLIDDRFLAGTNWVSVALCNFDEVAIQSDGSLWVSERPNKFWAYWRQPQPVRLGQFGEDHDWQMAAAYFNTVFLLKTNGSLWRWGSNHPDPNRKIWPGLRAFEPQRLGTNSLGTNSFWTEVFSENGEVYFRAKANAQYTRLWILTPEPRWSFGLDAETFLAEAHGWRSVVRIIPGRPVRNVLEVGVLKDGSLRALDSSDQGSIVSSQRPDGQSQSFVRYRYVRLGNDSNWQAVAGIGMTVVALKTDGSLWKWTFPEDPLTNPESASVSRLGSHSDWVAITATGDDIVALARDGSLWEFQSDRLSGSRSFSLLSASRRPQKLGNIFGNAP